MHSGCVSCVKPASQSVSQSVRGFQSCGNQRQSLVGRQAGRRRDVTRHRQERTRGRRNFGVNSRVTRALDSISRGYVNEIKSEKEEEQGERARARAQTEDSETEIYLR